MWSMDYVQVPAEDEKAEENDVKKDLDLESSNVKNDSENTKKRVHDLVKQISMSTESSGIKKKSVFYYIGMHSDSVFKK